MNLRHDGITPGETLLLMIERKEDHTEGFKDLVKFFGISKCEEMMEKARVARHVAKEFSNQSSARNAFKEFYGDVPIKSVEQVKAEVREPEEFEF